MSSHEKMNSIKVISSLTKRGEYMSRQSTSRSLISNPAVYRIYIAGRLSPEWSEYLQGMAISTVEEKEHGTCTVLSGPLPDQAALMGVLDYLYNNGVSVISMECISRQTNPKKKTKGKNE